MITGQIATRLTCFAILSAAEHDLRDAIADTARRESQVDILPSAVRERATLRWKDAKQGQDVIGAASDFELLEFTDFGDLAQLLNIAADTFWNSDRAAVSAVAKQLESLAAARNRVCHSRPLEPDDFASFMDFSRQVVRLDRTVPWKHLRATIEQLNSDPSFILKLTIPRFWLSDLKSVPHNLPLTEFDDTGFLGRTTDRSEVVRLLTSSHPVITLVGEGGVGKTALALRCLYDLLYQGEAAPYDVIVWVSLKAKLLTPGGAREIQDAITSSLGVVQTIGSQLGVPSKDEASIDYLLNEIKTYLQQFRILLAIDNLETLSGPYLRTLLTGLGPGSKVLITSRVGMGELELRYPVLALDDKTSAILLRRFAKVLKVHDLASAPAEVVSKYIKLLFSNPLLIKWFVSSVANGADPAKLLDRRSSSFADVLKFCFENLFDRLSDAEKALLHILASGRRPVTQAEIYYLTSDRDRTAIDWALNTLHRSSMVKTTLVSGSNEEMPRSSYSLTDIANNYISTLAPPSPATYNQVQRLLTELRTLTESSSLKTEAYKYDITVVRASNSDERICAVFLSRALRRAQSGNLEGARKLVEEARGLLPSFAETYRISGIIEAPTDPYKASQEFATAIDLDSTSPLIRYSFAYFLVKYPQDYEGALEQLELLAKLDSQDEAVKGLTALCLTRLGRFTDASQIYDSLIAGVSNRARKFRLLTFDQAAECLRRWARVDFRMKEDEAGLQHLRRAREILKAAYAAADMDDVTCRTSAELMEESMYHCIRTGNVTEAVNVMEAIVALAPVLRKGQVAFANVQEFERLLPRDMPGVQQLRDFKSQTTVHQRIDEPRKGRIKVIPKGTDFGFICGASGEEWYFHRSFLVNPHEWRTMKEDDLVEFRIGANALGVCAREVQLSKK